MTKIENKLEKIFVNWSDTKANNKKIEKFFNKNSIKI
jgi:hypothetical protein